MTKISKVLVSVFVMYVSAYVFDVAILNENRKSV